jgi:hypothetical protein
MASGSRRRCHARGHCPIYYDRCRRLLLVPQRWGCARRSPWVQCCAWSAPTPRVARYGGRGRGSDCTALAWEKKKTIARHLEQQLTAAQGITIPQDDDDDRSVDVGSNPDAALTAHLHAQAAGLQNILSVVTIVVEPSSPNYKRWCDLVLLTLRRYALDDHILSDVADPSVYWARLDSIVVT